MSRYKYRQNGESDLTLRSVVTVDGVSNLIVANPMLISLNERLWAWCDRSDNSARIGEIALGRQELSKDLSGAVAHFSGFAVEMSMYRNEGSGGPTNVLKPEFKSKPSPIGIVFHRANAFYVNLDPRPVRIDQGLFSNARLRQSGLGRIGSVFGTFTNEAELSEEKPRLDYRNNTQHDGSTGR